MSRVVILALMTAVAIVCMMPQRAAAQVTRAVIAGDGTYAVPVNASTQKSGIGFAGRLGARVGLPGAQQTWELGFDYASFDPADSLPKNAGYTAYRGVVGMRLGVDGVIEPGLFLHLGLGHLNGSLVTVTGPAPVVAPLSSTSFTWDGGVYLDFKLAHFLELGAQAAFDEITASSNARALRWFALSAHLQIVI